MQLQELIGQLKNSDSVESRAIVERLTTVILETNPGLSPAIKWRRLTFGLNGDFHHWICALEILKNNVSLTFHFGGLLADEDAKLTAGSSKFLRKMVFGASDEIDEATVREFVIKAIDKLPYFVDNWKEISKNG